MNVVPFSPEQRDYWLSDDSIVAAEPKIIGGPPSEPDCIPCPTIVTLTAAGSVVFRVPFKPDEVELAHLARGGTLWLSTWGSLPIHMLEVQEPAV